MSQVRLQLFGRNQISGRNFEPFEDGEIRNLATTFDDRHLIRIISNETNEVLLDNPADVPFEFTISGCTNNDVHVYAKCVYQPETRSIKVNNNWTIYEEGPSNEMVNDHSINKVSAFLNIRFHTANYADNSMCRLDLCINGTETSSMFFTPAELLFINLDGDETVESIHRLTNHFIELGSQIRD